MENLTRALYMVFAMLTFVIAFSVSLYLVNKLNTTTKYLVYELGGSYYDSLALGEIINSNEKDKTRSRVVGIDTIIPTLYRYYKESFAVKILDQEGNLLQYFDTTTEGEVNAASSIGNFYRTEKQKALMSLYDDSDKSCYLFQAPWLGAREASVADINKDAKTRIDMYISGGKGYINKTLIDYSKDYSGLEIGAGTKGTEANKIYLNNFKNREFKETFTQYAYDGDTISSSEEDGEIVTLTGSKQISTKIIIIYQLLP